MWHGACSRGGSCGLEAFCKGLEGGAQFFIIKLACKYDGVKRLGMRTKPFLKALGTHCISRSGPRPHPVACQALRRGLSFGGLPNGIGATAVLAVMTARCHISLMRFILVWSGGTSHGKKIPLRGR